VVGDRYRILALLGQGSMGMVYTAWHLGLDQQVAFKLLRRGLDGELDGVARQRFMREARAAARIQSDHVCRVIDNGALDDGTPFLVMEYLEGCDLAAEVAQRGRMPVHEAVRYVRQACAALAEVHRAGIVHRDLKPANLFLQDAQDALDPECGGRRIKVLDFGISKSTLKGVANLSLTRTSALLGSPIYMSPEQLNSSRDVDARSDIWALGVILYELITGAMPFEGSSITQLVNAVLHREPAPCSFHGIEIAPALEQIVERALRKDRALRFQTAAEFSLALALFERAPGQVAPDSNAFVPEGLGPRCDLFASTLDLPSPEQENWQDSTMRVAAVGPRPSSAPRAKRWRLLWLSLGAVAAGVLLSRAPLDAWLVRGAAAGASAEPARPILDAARATGASSPAPQVEQPGEGPDHGDWARPAAPPLRAAPDEGARASEDAQDPVTSAQLPTPVLTEEPKPALVGAAMRRPGGRRHSPQVGARLAASEAEPDLMSVFGGRR
jgi:serine/threonine-protein kinase